MTNALFLVPGFALLVGGGLGYLLGRYQSQLLDKIRILEEQGRKPKAEPAITLGVYEKPKPISGEDKKVGVAEPKTPQQLDWESEQQIEKVALGR